MFTLLKRPSAFSPVMMSLAALALVLGKAAVFGVVHEADEGADAHVFQLLMVAQLPIVGFFVVKWLPQTRKPGFQVLALQGGAALAAWASVFLLT